MSPSPSHSEQHPMGRFEWERLLRRIVLPEPVKLLAFILATYADPDGTRVRPGQDVLAAIMNKTDRTVRRHLDVLCDELGLIQVVARGGGRGRGRRTTVYRLTVPADLLDRVEMLSPAERPWKTPDTQTSGQSGETPDTQTSGQCGQSPVDNSETPDTQVSPQLVAVDSIDRTPDDTSEQLTGHLGSIDRTPGCPTTNHLPTTKDDQPTNHDPAQPPTARHPDASQEDHGDGGEETTPELPARCAHNLVRRTRPDGKPGCAFCRRDATRGPT